MASHGSNRDRGPAVYGTTGKTDGEAPQGVVSPVEPTRDLRSVETDGGTTAGSEPLPLRIPKVKKHADASTDTSTDFVDRPEGEGITTLIQKGIFGGHAYTAPPTQGSKGQQTPQENVLLCSPMQLNALSAPEQPPVAVNAAPVHLLGKPFTFKAAVQDVLTPADAQLCGWSYNGPHRVLPDHLAGVGRTAAVVSRTAPDDSRLSWHLYGHNTHPTSGVLMIIQPMEEFVADTAMHSAAHWQPTVAPATPVVHSALPTVATATVVLSVFKLPALSAAPTTHGAQPTVTTATLLAHSALPTVQVSAATAVLAALQLPKCMVTTTTGTPVRDTTPTVASQSTTAAALDAFPVVTAADGFKTTLTLGDHNTVGVRTAFAPSTEFVILPVTTASPPRQAPERAKTTTALDTEDGEILPQLSSSTQVLLSVNGKQYFHPAPHVSPHPAGACQPKSDTRDTGRMP